MNPRFFASLPFCVLSAASFFSSGAAQTAPVVVPPSTPLTTVLATTEQDAAVLARYQLALDQLATGATATARVILEDSVRRYGPRPEINLLLAYVLQREGNNNGALNAANQVASASALAAAFSGQLQGATSINTTVLHSPPVTPITVGPLGVGPLVESGLVAVAPKSNASLPQNDARLAKLELTMMDMVNTERAKVGLGALQWNDDLASVARAHAAEMRDKNYFSHESPTPGITTHLDRYRAAGYEAPRVIAENIFRAWGSPKQVSLSDVQQGHTALMQSPGHRANILYRDISQIGIGIATDTKGDIWIAQMFLRP